MTFFLRIILLATATTLIMIACNTTREENTSLVNRWMCENVVVLDMVFKDTLNPPPLLAQMTLAQVLSEAMTNAMSGFIFDIRNDGKMILTTAGGFIFHETTYTVENSILGISYNDQTVRGFYQIRRDMLGWDVYLQYLLDLFKEFDLETDFFKELNLGDFEFDGEKLGLENAVVSVEFRKL
ncbi:MAG: hypothetical protein FWC94_02455 [Bacteroidales bacterium]|nr:hypothetical protein [Bacteroidales bacterium]